MPSPIYDTMSEQIEEETDEIMSYRNLHSYVKIKDVESKSILVVPYTSITSEYRHFLEDHIIEIELDDDEYSFYRHNPQAVSSAVYDTIHYWGLILELNHCKSRIDFDKKKIRLYNPESFEEVIEEIMDKEELLEDV